MKTPILAAVLLALATPAFAHTVAHKHHRHVVASAVIPASAMASVPYADASGCHTVRWSTWDLPPFVGTACGPQ